jgi:membrane protein DedA with SNARE-associated domain
MNFPKFILYTFLGSLPWSFALAYIGWKFGPALNQKISQLSTVFHGLDVVIIVLFLAAVGLYIYRHLKHDKAARERGGYDAVDQQPTMPYRKL